MAKNILVIMGSHPNSRKSFDWSREDCDIWLFNEAPTGEDESGNKIYKKCDAFFQLHHEAIWRSPKNRSDEHHGEWLRSGKTPPVYMQKKYSDVPKAIKYPIEDVLELTKNVKLANGKDFKCFTSSPDLALALVANLHKKGLRYKKVEMWGIELETESEYRYQRLGFGFWLGYLAGIGVELEIHNDMFNLPIYGYEGDLAISSDDIKRRVEELTEDLDELNYKYQSSEVLNKVPVLLYADVGKEIQDSLNTITRGNEMYGILNGRIKEDRRYLEKAVAMEKEAECSVFSAGEFDSIRLDYTKQYADVYAQTNSLNTALTLVLRNLLTMEKWSEERKKAVDEFGTIMAELMNKNMLLLHIIGGIRENQFYLDSFKLSIERSK